MRSAVKKNGYVYVYMPEHRSADNRGYVLEHIVVAENKLGRPLRRSEEVHHLDFNKANNKKSNLLVLLKSQHLALHGWLTKGAPLGHSKVSLKRKARRFISSGKDLSKDVVCKTCGRSLVSVYSVTYCSNPCAAASRQYAVSKKEMAFIMKKHSSWVSRGKALGVSDNGARKIARRLGLD